MFSQILGNTYASGLLHKTCTSLKRTWQRNKERAEKQQVASKSFRSLILEDIQIPEIRFEDETFSGGQPPDLEVDG